MPPTQSTSRRRSRAIAPSTARATTGRPRYSEWSLMGFAPQYVPRGVQPTKFLMKNSGTWLNGIAYDVDPSNP